MRTLFAILFSLFSVCLYSQKLGYVKFILSPGVAITAVQEESIIKRDKFKKRNRRIINYEIGGEVHIPLKKGVFLTVGMSSVTLLYGLEASRRYDLIALDLGLNDVPSLNSQIAFLETVNFNHSYNIFPFGINYYGSIPLARDRMGIYFFTHLMPGFMTQTKVEVVRDLNFGGTRIGSDVRDFEEFLGQHIQSEASEFIMGMKSGMGCFWRFPKSLIEFGGQLNYRIFFDSPNKKYSNAPEGATWSVFLNLPLRLKSRVAEEDWREVFRKVGY